MSLIHREFSGETVHTPITWTYANAAARTGASGFVSGDLYKLARQSDNNTLWMLTETTPAWVLVSLPLESGKIPSGYLPESPNAAVDLPVFNSLLAQLSAARASGAVPNGWCWLFKTDELATKTNATYDAAGDYYGNREPQTLRDLGTNSASGFTNPNNAFDGNTATYASGPAYGTGNYIVKLFGETVTLTSVTVLFVSNQYMPTGDLYYTTDGGTSWTLLASASFTYTNPQVAQTISFSQVDCNGIKLVETSSYSNNECNIAEINPIGMRGATNMTLKPSAITLSAEPNTAGLYLLHKAVDAVTLNTDLKARVSLNGGSNWSSFGTLETVCAYDADYNLLKAELDLSALTGTSFVWEITTLNAKSQRVRAVAALFS